MTIKKKKPPTTLQKKQIVFESLAVKYRPTVLEDILGQDHLVPQIRGMLKSGRFPPTLLLTGASGVGKTTTARMIARYINCEDPDPQTYEPCGECTNCQYMDDHPDVVEMNMADTRGIDDIRALIVSSRNMPSLGRYRVFILDEVHQLTKEAFQTLLKILEDAPKHTMWVLATTDRQKIPPTILGRCHELQLNRIEKMVIVKRLHRIAKDNGVNFQEMEGGVAVLKQIADLAGGQMRDSIKMLDQAIFTIKSGAKFDAAILMKQYVETDEAQVERHAAYLVCCLFTNNFKGVIKTVTVNNSDKAAQDLWFKTVYLVQYLMDNLAGCAKFTPHSGKMFAEVSKGSNIKVNLPRLAKIQRRLQEVEFQTRTTNMPRAICLSAGLCDILTEPT